MSKVPDPSPPTPNTPNFVSGIDVIDEIRRHLRTLEIITRKGDGITIFAGQEVQIVDTDPSLLDEDIKKALDEMKALSEFLGHRKA